MLLLKEDCTSSLVVEIFDDSDKDGADVVLLRGHHSIKPPEAHVQQVMKGGPASNGVSFSLPTNPGSI